MHMTGRYPDWWTGHRFDRPIRVIAGSESLELTRKGIQRVLFGPPETRNDWGTGTIPQDCLADEPSMRSGVADAIATATVKHVSGGESSLQLLSYDMGRSKWQADTVDLAWMDEEPPAEIYTEALTRTNVASGPVILTATPLNGMTEIIGYFYPKPNTPQRSLTMMTIDDVDHYTAAQKATIIAQYPAHEREARLRGIPMLGSGRIFPLPEEAIRCEPFAIPAHWPQINAIDFGWDHPFAAVSLAWDREADCVYVHKTYRESQATPPIHVAAVLPWGDWIPTAWPHDGLNSEKGTGVALKAVYTELNLLPERAEDESGSISVEAGLLEMLTRMQTGRFKVFAHLGDWFEEFRQYHRKAGKIVKLRDDLISATRYGVVSLRFAETKRPVLPEWQRKRRGVSRRGSAWAS
jgi:phage terminase large subunit-like protein